jgi:hypothetical protein
MTTHRISPVALGALAVTAASYLIEVAPLQDATYPLFMLGGPIGTGIGLGRRWRVGAAAWFCAAMVWLLTDWAINHEDVAFHAVVGVICAGLVALGAGVARAARTFDGRQQSSA